MITANPKINFDSNKDIIQQHTQSKLLYAIDIKKWHNSEIEEKEELKLGNYDVITVFECTELILDSTINTYNLSETKVMIEKKLLQAIKFDYNKKYFKEVNE